MDKNNYIYGRNSVMEALSSRPKRINKVLISKSSSKDPKIDEIIKLAKKYGVVFQFVPKEKFQELSNLPHQGVMAMVAPVEYVDFYDFLVVQKEKKGYSKLIILDGVEDPHNLGAIIRTAACAGFDAVIIPSRRNAQVSAIVEKTSAGAINHIPLIQVNSLSNIIDKLKDNDYWIIAADAHGKDNYYDVDYTDMNFAIIMGGEETGVSKNNMKNSDFVVKIPMLRNFNSLNVSNAASAIIYESVRQMITKQKHSV
ncbi:MAG: 23S rRNA (guanosine(2251)-2'-O)-methyltransferase RlmB [Clostridium sp.]|nr:23S rRNA (guanosine(2251)-2'-O)-methyltransferase RlmB [Clostridium sp.]